MRLISIFVGLFLFFGTAAAAKKTTPTKPAAKSTDAKVPKSGTVITENQCESVNSSSFGLDAASVPPKVGIADDPVRLQEEANKAYVALVVIAVTAALALAFNGKYLSVMFVFSQALRRQGTLVNLTR